MNDRELTCNCERTHAHTRARTHGRTHTNTPTHAHTHARTHVRTYVRTHARTHTYTHTHIHTYTHTHIHTHTHTHTLAYSCNTTIIVHPATSNIEVCLLVETSCMITCPHGTCSCVAACIPWWRPWCYRWNCCKCTCSSSRDAVCQTYAYWGCLTYAERTADAKADAATKA